MIYDREAIKSLQAIPMRRDASVLDGVGDGRPKPATIWYPQDMNVRFANCDRLLPGFVAASLPAPVPEL